MILANEPVLTAATISGLVGAVLVLLVAFGVQLTETQQVAILGVVAFLAPVIAGYVARSKVTPTVKLEQVPSGPAALEQVEAKG